MIILQKTKHFDKEVFNSSLQKHSESVAEDIKIHFVYAESYYGYPNEDKLRSIILKGLKKYGIKSAMVTSIYLERKRLITNEKMELLQGRRVVERIGQ